MIAQRRGISERCGLLSLRRAVAAVDLFIVARVLHVAHEAVVAPSSGDAWIARSAPQDVDVGRNGVVDFDLCAGAYDRRAWRAKGREIEFGRTAERSRSVGVRFAVWRGLVPLAGIEPALLAELDFESSASTSSATGARTRRMVGDIERRPRSVNSAGKDGRNAANSA
jgi:hypothetical protein